MKKELQQEIEEHFHDMQSFFSPNEKARFRDCEEDEVWRYHFGFGLWIRNTLLLPNERLYKMFIEEGISQKDDMSAYMIYQFHQYLREQTKNTP